MKKLVVKNRTYYLLLFLVSVGTFVISSAFFSFSESTPHKAYYIPIFISCATVFLLIYKHVHSQFLIHVLAAISMVLGTAWFVLGHLPKLVLAIWKTDMSIVNKAIDEGFIMALLFFITSLFFSFLAQNYAEICEVDS